jgi:hypothetical protein
VRRVQVETVRSKRVESLLFAPFGEVQGCACQAACEAGGVGDAAHASGDLHCQDAAFASDDELPDAGGGFDDLGAIAWVGLQDHVEGHGFCPSWSALHWAVDTRRTRIGADRPDTLSGFAIICFRQCRDQA